MKTILLILSLIFVRFIECKSGKRTNLTLENDEDIDLRFVAPQYGNITVFDKIECHERRSQTLDWMHHDNFYGCINLVTDTTLPSCLYKQLERNGLIYMNKNKSKLLENMHREKLRRSKCSSFMFITQDLHFIEEIFGPARQLFRPRTNIFLFMPANMTLSERVIIRTIKRGYNVYKIQNRFFDESLPYFSLNYWNVTNIQTNKTLHTYGQNDHNIANLFGSLNAHPLFDPSFKKNRPFRIGLYHCPPNVIVRDAKTYK